MCLFNGICDTVVTFTDCVVLPWVLKMNELVNVRIAGGKFMISARLSFLFFKLFMRHIINNLVTPTVWSLRENLKPRPTVLTSLSLDQYRKASHFEIFS